MPEAQHRMPSPGVQHTAWSAALLWSGWMLMLACALLRIQAAIVPFPYWDVDPTTNFLPVLGLGPAASVLVDVLMMLGAGVALLGAGLRGDVTRPIHLASALLIAFGAAGVSLHAWVLHESTIEDVRIGATWVAAMMAGLAALVVCGDERLRRLTFALGIGAIAMLAAKGVLQVFVEHPMTVREFRMNREAFFAAQGWRPDSPAARSFERRLMQPEATGWFGMANVYGSFAAASFAALLGLTIIAWREARIRKRLPDGWAGLLTFGAAAAALGLILSGGKGGLGAAAVGMSVLVLVAAAWKLGLRITRRTGGLIGIGIVAAGLGAVIVIGAGLGELSLLFRWFYMQGAARIIAENPLFGVGPAGFKDAYMLAKPPISPEEVTSPHSVLFDWLATLGIFGLAWCAVWLAWVWLAGARLAVRPSSERPGSGASDHQPAATMRGSFDSPGERIDARIILTLVLATMIASALLERHGTTIESLVARLVGAAGWIGIAIAMLAVMRAVSWRWAGAAAALALVVHAQIEVTPVWPGSAALFMILIASVAAPPLALTPSTGAVMPAGVAAIRRITPAAIALAAATASAWLSIIPVARWEGQLRAAALAVAPVAEVRGRIERVVQAGGTTLDGDSIPHIAVDLAAMIGQPPAQSREEFDRQLNLLLAQAAARAQERLTSAFEHSRDEMLTARALVEAAILRAQAEAELGRVDEARRQVQQAEEFASALAERRPRANAFGLLGNIRAVLADLDDDPAHLERAIDAWTEAAELDPYGLPFPWRIYRALEDMGKADTPRGIHWGRRVLELDEALRLDEVKRLQPRERDRVKRNLEQARPLP